MNNIESEIFWQVWWGLENYDLLGYNTSTNVRTIVSEQVESKVRGRISQAEFVRWELMNEFKVE
jgi:hypothetical protein